LEMRKFPTNLRPASDRRKGLTVLAKIASHSFCTRRGD
jgi:hypothetical protein